jgi:hypothetical protein
MRERIHHMRGVNVRVCVLYIDRGATETACPAVRKMRRHPEMGIVHGVFPRRPSLMASIFFKIGVSAFRKILSPRGFKIGPRLFEGLCRAFGMPAIVGWGVEAALPAPLVDIDRDASAGRYCPDADIATIDVPAVGAIG